MDQALLYVVTGLGIMLSLFSFVVIFRGQRIPGDTGTAQELEFQGLKLKTNVVVMLLAVSVIVAVLPLLLQAWLTAKAQDISAKAQPTSAALAPAKPRELLISLTGQVLDGKNPIEGARITVFNLRDVKPGDPLPEVAHTETDANGSFDIQQFPLGEGDRYKVVAAKEGFVEQVVRMGPGGAVIFSTILVARKKTGGQP